MAVAAGKARTQLVIRVQWRNAKNALALDVLDLTMARAVASVTDGDVADAIASVDAVAEPCTEAAGQIISYSTELGRNVAFVGFGDEMIGIAKAAVDGVSVELNAQGAVAG
ncbi:hypothetical protein RFM98_00265 [Mesorhizobium sp. VK9D]|uniref:hypothetical protein n=1 Tax=Mesorhizobium australafricanum TaxID=3072311 RepID=UPI002A246CFA|nr:hypothetical protein [Mesorhizobium sp. VK9D]MDX8451184.1 hypothetical protein [Mesorhizobium sp. VK9D]